LRARDARWRHESHAPALGYARLGEAPRVADSARHGPPGGARTGAVGPVALSTALRGAHARVGERSARGGEATASAPPREWNGSSRPWHFVAPLRRRLCLSPSRA